MSSTNVNEMNTLSQSFKAFIQFQDPEDLPNFLRVKSLQEVTTQYDFTDEDRYNDEGKLSLVRNGQNHNCNMTLILTESEIDTASPPTDESTVSWWLYQKFLGNRVQIVVRETFVTEPSNAPFTLRNDFTMDLQQVGTIRNVGGAIELPIGGRILDTAIPTFIKTNPP